MSKILHDAPGVNTAAVVTLPATTDQRHSVWWIGWSYNGVPTAGNLKIEDDGTEILSLDVTLGGNDQIIFGTHAPVSVDVNTDMVVTLHAGGLTAKAKLTVCFDTDYFGPP